MNARARLLVFPSHCLRTERAVVKERRTGLRGTAGAAAGVLLRWSLTVLAGRRSGSRVPMLRPNRVGRSAFLLARSPKHTRTRTRHAREEMVSRTAAT